MTKPGQSDAKPSQVSPPPPVYSSVPMPAVQRVGPQVNLKGNTCWYVFGVLATIFCCLPCGVIGLVHAMIAKHEGERGNYAGFRKRMFQAKCWTCWSIVLGLLFLLVTILTTIGMTIGFRRTYDWICGTGYYYDDDYYYNETWSGSSWNSTWWW